MDEVPRSPARAKSTVRKEILRRRDAMAEEIRRNLSQSIVQKIVALTDYQQASVIMAYASFGSELRTDTFLRSVLEHGKTLVLPRVSCAKKFLDLYEVEDIEWDLEAGVWGIPEPKMDLGAVVELAAVDFVLVPGVAFDMRGGRLGHGAGFYDKLLGSSGRRLHLVAGAFDVQMVEELPLEQHDVLMALVVTENGSYPLDTGTSTGQSGRR